MSNKYNHISIEKKWQKYWNKSGIFRAKNKSQKPKFYCLDMFPYPSNYGLHVGHFKGYTISDVIAKKKLMEGFNVLHPMGWDAFGLPAENFAIKTGIHPALITQKAIRNIRKQLFLSGLGYDWTREIATCKPEYYKWTQWMFLQLYKNGLAYRKKSKVNFCPNCKTVLANEQVIDGKCERCKSEVEKKELEQWFFKITAYTEKLLKGLDNLNWPDRIKKMQKNWIGKSEGTKIKFVISKSLSIDVFTTRVDTLFGCTYVVIAPEHPLIKKLKNNIVNWKQVEAYIKRAIRKPEIERLAEDKEKTGIEIKGIQAINPINNKKVPVFVGDYVLLEYGTGAIMAVPAHDQRDFIFAKKHRLPIIEVVKPKNKKSPLPIRAFEEDGILVNSKEFSGLESAAARKKITKYLEKQNLGEKLTCYKLKDWLISRQRYWGAPIPMVFCKNCGWQPIEEKDLPVLLPNIKNFKPAKEGKSPLAKSERFVNTKCPKCGKRAKRETDTMDTFVCSSWYFFRYTDPKNKKTFASKDKIKKWLPVDLYIGGAEHACMHLLYARFLTKALKDLKYIDFEEPFLKLFNQGTIYYQGAKMSKSKGNVISPDEIIKKYGADTLRLYELFMGPAEQSSEWSSKGIVGCYRFLQKIWNLQKKLKKTTKENPEIKKIIHKAIKKVTEDIEEFKFNTAISSLMVLTNKLEKIENLPLSAYQNLLKLLSPFAPHICEELWEKTGNKKSIFSQPWPKYNPRFIKEEMFTLIIQINGRFRAKIGANIGISKNKAKEIALRQEKIKKWVSGKKIKKIIYIPNKVINIII